MSLQLVPPAEKLTKLFVGAGALIFALLIVAGIFAKNGWFPSTDGLGTKKGRFGRPQAKNVSSSWNPFASAPSPTPLPLSKSYVYAGSKLVAVQDANA